jgi:hypothetical protein
MPASDKTTVSQARQETEKERLAEQARVIDGAKRKADAATKFSYTWFLIGALMSTLGVAGAMTAAFFGLPFLILSKTFDGIMTALSSFDSKNITLGKLIATLVAAALMSCAMLIIMISMTTAVHAALIASLSTLAVVFFSIDAIYHIGGFLADCYKAFMAPSNSNERKAYLQAAFKHVVNFAISLGILALLTVSLSPPGLIGVAAATIGLCTCSMGWSLIPNKWRQGIKRFFGLEKTTHPLEITSSKTLANAKQHDVSIAELTADIQKEKSHYGNFFKRAYRRDVVIHYMTENKVEATKDYLHRQIDGFKAKYANAFPDNHLPQKQQAKINALNEAEALIDQKAPVSKDAISDIIAKYPLSAQSFFADVGDASDILEAIDCFLINNEAIHASTMTM